MKNSKNNYEVKENKDFYNIIKKNNNFGKPKIKIKMSELIINSFNEVVRKKEENNDKSLISLYELQKEIYNNSNYIMKRHKIRKVLNKKQKLKMHSF